MKFMFFNKISPYFIEKKHKLHLNHLFCRNHTCYCANMVFVTSASCYITSASCYHPRYQSRSSMYIRGLIPRKSAELDEAVPIGCSILHALQNLSSHGLLSCLPLSISKLCTTSLKDVYAFLCGSLAIDTICKF